MADKSHKEEIPRTAYLTDSYDEIPQPKGKFRSLFQEMREKSEAKNMKDSDK